MGGGLSTQGALFGCCQNESQYFTFQAIQSSSETLFKANKHLAVFVFKRLNDVRIIKVLAIAIQKAAIFFRSPIKVTYNR